MGCGQSVSDLTASHFRQYIETFSAILALCEGIHRSVGGGALIFSLLLAVTSCSNSWVVGDLRRHGTHMTSLMFCQDKIWGMTNGRRYRECRSQISK